MFWFFLPAETLADVLVRAHNGDVGSVTHGSLEESVDQPLPSCDILLVIGYIGREACPSVAARLLRLVEIGSQDLEASSRDPSMAQAGVSFLQSTPEESRAGDRST